MKLREIYNIADEIAPFSLSGEYCGKYESYDNSGILLDCGKEIKTALFALDCSARSVEEAKKIHAELLFTHHPAIYSPIKNLLAASPVTACATAGISIISAHLNLDCAEGGIDDSLALALGAGGEKSRMHTLTKGGYGSVFDIEKTPLEGFVKEVKKRLNSERVLVYGDKPVKRVASFCGAGMDEETIRFAAENGADTFVSADPKHHLIAAVLEHGMNLVVLTHFASENYGFKKFYQKMKENCSGVRMEYFTDERF